MAGSHLPPGFRFHPTDEELLVLYLKRRAAGKLVDERVIGEIDIYKYEPAELPGMAVLQSSDTEWFFFNLQKKNQLHGSRTNRTAKGGYWKATGKDRRLVAGSCVGLKKTLVYLSGRAPHGERTDWVMHEFRLDEGAKKERKSTSSVVLCRIRRKGGRGPHDGEEYGAPVFEEEEEEASNLASNTHLPSYMSEKPMGQSHIQVSTPALPASEDSRTAKEDFNVFLRDFFSYEDLQADEDPTEELMVNELLSLLNDQSDIALAPSTSSWLSNIDFSNIDSSSNQLQSNGDSSVMLQDMLRFVNGQLEGPPEHPTGVQGPFHSFQMEHLQSVGFLELADLEEPFQNQSSVGPIALENLLFELDAGMESSISSGLTQDKLQLQQNMRGFVQKEDVKSLLPVESSGIYNESEVSVDSSQVLSALEIEYARLLTADDDGMASGRALCSGQERRLALSHFLGIRAQEQPEAGHDELENFVEKDDPLLGAVSCVEPGVDHAERHVDSTTEADRNVISEAGPLTDDNDRSIQRAPRQPSPSTVVRVISGLLGKFNALPASAEELPLKWGQHLLISKERSLSCVTESKGPHLAFVDSASVNISGFSMSPKIEWLSLLQQKETIQRSPLRSMPSMASFDRHCRRFVKRLTNGVSMFLFCITTLALVLFCMFRGFCRSTRAALA